MNEFSQIREAVLLALRNAGLDAQTAFPDRQAVRTAAPVLSVAVGALEGKNCAFANYLGEFVGEDGRVRERYGKCLEGLIAVDVRAESAAACEDAVQSAASVLLGRLPQGIRPGELRWEALAWEPVTRTFLRRGSLQCSALFLAEDDGDDGEFLDFILKGVLLA